MLKFIIGNVLSYNGEFYQFSSPVFLLLQQFCETPKHFLSKEDIRQDVLYNEDASETSIRNLIYNARIELSKTDLPLEIRTICRKGYKLELVKSVLPDELPPEDEIPFFGVTHTDL
jgi:DNA-binding winged helix-turn-helix (wHTH) protein